MNELSVLLIFLVLIACVDSFTTGISIMSIISSPINRNFFVYTIAFGGALAITGFVITTKTILKSNIILLKILWLIAVSIDVFTNISSVVFYLLLQNNINTRINFETIRKSFDLGNSFETVIVLGITVLLTGCAVAVSYVYDKTIK